MGSSTLITDYLGAGTHAARNATPPIPVGSTAIYTETDTSLTFAFIPGTGWIQIGFTEAPEDGATYGRSDGAWVAAVAEAPNDGNPYVRYDKGWEVLPPYPAAGIAEAPDDGNPYVRESDGWVPLPPYPAAGIPEAPDDGQGYVRKSEAWAVEASGGGVPEAPNDGQLYGRKSEAWAVVTGGGGGGGGGGPPTGQDFLDDTDMGVTAFYIARDYLSAHSLNNGGNGAWKMVRGNTIKLAGSGKVYWEVHVPQLLSSDGFHGATEPGTDPNHYPGQISGFGRGYDGNTVSAWGGAATNGGGFAAGDVLGIALDIPNGNVTFYRNNVADGGVTGMAIPSDGVKLALACRAQGDALFKLATTAAACTYAPPAGFANWT